MLTHFESRYTYRITGLLVHCRRYGGDMRHKCLVVLRQGSLNRSNFATLWPGFRATQQKLGSGRLKKMAGSTLLHTYFRLGRLRNRPDGCRAISYSAGAQAERKCARECSQPFSLAFQIPISVDLPGSRRHSVAKCEHLMSPASLFCDCLPHLRNIDFGPKRQ